MAGSNEITIAISSTEEDIRKLYDASKAGSIQILKTLLQDDPNLLKKLPMISTSNNESPLHVSVSHGHLEFTRLLLDHSPELVVEVDAFQRTPLHLAATNGYLEIVKALLERNTSACLVRDQEGLIPLHYAVINGQIEIIQELINARPQSIWMKLESGQTILHLCVERTHLEVMKLLTELVANQDKNFLNTIDDVGNTILDLSLTLKQIEMIRYLLSIPEVKNGASIGNFTVTKDRQKSKKKKSKKMKRQRQKLASSSIKEITKAGRWNTWQQKLKYKGDWVQEVQGTMMLVASVIATVAFQAAINPPGGVWQQDTVPNNSSKLYRIYGPFYSPRAGTAIMLSQYPFSHLIYLISIKVSFLASLIVILLIISRFPLKNRICSWMLSVAMCAAVFFLGVGFVVGVQMVWPSISYEDDTTYVEIISWLAVAGLVGLWYTILFLVWVVKKLIRTFTSNRNKSYT